MLSWRSKRAAIASADQPPTSSVVTSALLTVGHGVKRNFTSKDHRVRRKDFEFPTDKRSYLQAACPMDDMKEYDRGSSG